MPVDLQDTLVVGITSSALFDMTEADTIYRTDGLAAYTDYQLKNAEVPLKPGTGFALVKALLRLNETKDRKSVAPRRAEVVVASKNSPATCERLYNSIKHYGLHDIQRSFLTGGRSIAPYLQAFSVDLFLSRSIEDVEAALASDIPAAVVYTAPQNVTDDISEIRIAFDGDAVLFSDESEVVFQKHGLDRFVKNEKNKVNIPLPQGPFFKLLKMLSLLQSNEEGISKPPVRIALITARSMPTHERVIRTLKQWNVRVDEAFFMGGVPKTDVLRTFRPHIFFDDQEAHCDRAADVVATARVPARKAPKSNRRAKSE